MDVLRQILNLIIASLPTVVIVFLFYLFAKVAFFRPITRVLAERAARTEGARIDAAHLDTQAQEKLSLYHRALDKARSEIYSEQDASRRGALEERAKLLRESRSRANERVRQAKERFEKDLAASRDEVERESHRLAEEAIRAVLAEGSPAPQSAGDA